MKKNRVIALLVGITIATTVSNIYANANFKVRNIRGSSEEISTQINKDAFRKSEEAILINDESDIDSISATPLAYLKNAPIITTEWKRIDSKTTKYIKDSGIKKITIIGGLKNVSKTVEVKLNKLGIETNRIYGADRYETAIKIANEIKKESKQKSDEVIIISSTAGIENSIAITDFACKNNIPILWGDDNNLDPIIKYVKSKKFKKVYAIGDGERFKYYAKEGIKNVKLIKEINPYDTNMKYITDLYKGKSLDTIYTININYGNKGDISQYLSLPVAAAKQNIPILICNENFSHNQERFIEKNVTEIIEVGQEVGKYSIWNTFKSASFIKAMILLVVIIIIIVRGMKIAI